MVNLGSLTNNCAFSDFAYFATFTDCLSNDFYLASLHSQMHKMAGTRPHFPISFTTYVALFARFCTFVGVALQLQRVMILQVLADLPFLQSVQQNNPICAMKDSADDDIPRDDNWWEKVGIF